ncbi:long-chain N-acyl amino acid synthase [Pelomonas sp. KK5]|uniref:N-acyl amino acid synthase FeeM domain-containing protein n=1 Tax=Pelomonas sp. KK5 TaxID=1855730 RepID=UPI00117E29A7|nr:long-chain N-acyl amino acid synthase [Pelomonas sp. KK5]
MWFIDNPGAAAFESASAPVPYLAGLPALRTRGFRPGHAAPHFNPVTGELIEGFAIHAALDRQQRHAARALQMRRYAQRGYQVKDGGDDLERHLLTLRAECDERTVGTLGIRCDSEHGLNAELVFPDEVAAMRDAGRSLCEFTKLALDQQEAPSKHVLAALFHTAYIHAHHITGAKWLVIEVNPRHVPYYRRMLGFKVSAEARPNPRVKAPAVLMTLDFGFVEQQVEAYGGRPELSSETRTLYPYFYSPEEEFAILERMRGSDSGFTPFDDQPAGFQPS